jgi:putative membrane protein
MILRRNLKWQIILRHTWRSVAFFALTGLLAAALAHEAHLQKEPVPPAAVSALSAALAIFLAFRNSAAYDRWWEARKQWGTLINASRSFSRQVLTLTGADAAAAAPLLRRQIAFAHSLRLQLRGQARELPDALAPLLDAAELKQATGSTNPAMWILQAQAQAVRALKPDPVLHARIDDTLTVFTDVQGACERIKNTPVPRQYEYFPRIFVYVYATLLPASLVVYLGWWTPLVSVPITFLFLALERVGDVIEAPFENRPADVPMSSLCRVIERNLRELAGEKELPPPLEPVDGFLF